METRKQSILSVDSLQIGYGHGRRKKILLSRLNACAFRGELVALIGRNGIGKSTLLRSIIGLQPSYEGKILINGENLSDIPRLDLAKRIGYISTEMVRVSNMTVFDLVSLGRFPHTNWIGSIDGRSREAIRSAIERSGMINLANRYISELSDGERQRGMIARLLAQDAGIMIMDEPTAFLDLPGKIEIMNLLKSLSLSGRTIIFSTHDINVALKLADRIWMMLKDGIIEGTPEELVENGSFDNLFEPAEQDPGFSSGFNVRDYLKNLL